ncbi:MAG: hypothetical protein PHP69_02250 [Candidatus Omnitrophica bacterium]|nr:hypothetical protein [Candidatus Omnitrophota bacterium]MDD5441362.1 hypothetical protein [Candidatus Omnitrophota bacterium]
MKNKKWIKPEMLRIKLNPEQAVLSCCNSAMRALDNGGHQCGYPAFTCGTSYGNLDSVSS